MKGVSQYSSTAGQGRLTKMETDEAAQQQGFQMVSSTVYEMQDGWRQDWSLPCRVGRSTEGQIWWTMVWLPPPTPQCSQAGGLDPAAAPRQESCA